MLFVCYPKCSTCMKAKKWLEEKEIELKRYQRRETNSGRTENVVEEKRTSVEALF